MKRKKHFFKCNTYYKKKNNIILYILLGYVFNCTVSAVGGGSVMTLEVWTTTREKSCVDKIALLVPTLPQNQCLSLMVSARPSPLEHFPCLGIESVFVKMSANMSLVGKYSSKINLSYRASRMKLWNIFC